MSPASNRGPGRSSSRGAGPGAGRTGRGTPTSTRGAARAAKATPTAPQRPARFTTRAVVLVGVVLLLLASYTSSFHAWWSQRQQISSTKAEIATRKEAIANLQDDEKRFKDPAYIEAQARKRFGWVMPGEVGYRVIGANGKVQGDVPTLDNPPSPKQQPWYGKLWGTVQEAGKTPTRAKKAPESNPNKVLKNK